MKNALAQRAQASHIEALYHESWCSVACKVRCRSTWSTSAYQSPTSLFGSNSGLPVDDSWFFCDTGCKRTADGLSLLLAYWPGTHSWLPLTGVWAYYTPMGVLYARKFDQNAQN